MSIAKKPKIPPMAKPTIETRDIPGRGREHFIGFMAKKHNWTYGCELGVWKGRTFLYLLSNCPNLKMVGVDLWEAQPNNEGPENYIDWPHDVNENIVRSRAEKYKERAVILKMKTYEAANHVEDNSLDFVFIDADHSSKAVENDIKTWLPKVKDTGYIIGHDINWETVRPIVERYFPGYSIGPDNVWFRRKVI